MDWSHGVEFRSEYGLRSLDSSENIFVSINAYQHLLQDPNFTLFTHDYFQHQIVYINDQFQNL